VNGARKRAQKRAVANVVAGREDDRSEGELPLFQLPRLRSRGCCPPLAERLSLAAGRTTITMKRVSRRVNPYLEDGAVFFVLFFPV